MRDVLALLVGAVNRDHGEVGRLAGDLRHLLSGNHVDSTLDAALVVPRTELGVRLSRARRNGTKRASEAALRACDAPLPMGGEGIDRVGAAKALRAALDGMTPAVLYEATDHGVVARALLAKRGSPRLRHARCHVVFSIVDLHRAHRLYVFARFGRAELARELGVSAASIRLSHHLPEGILTGPLRDVEAELRSAVRSAGHRAPLRTQRQRGRMTTGTRGRADPRRNRLQPAAGATTEQHGVSQGNHEPERPGPICTTLTGVGAPEIVFPRP